MLLLTLTLAAAATATPPPPNVGRLQRWDLDQPLEQLLRQPWMKGCTLPSPLPPSGHGECAFPAELDRVARVQLAWNDEKPSGQLLALRLIFDEAKAPPLTELEPQLERIWGQASLEQLRREHGLKQFVLEWEDPDHRATLEAQGQMAQPSRATALSLERRAKPPGGELSGLRPRPFGGFRLRGARRVLWEGQPYAVVWGTSLSPAQEAAGESGPNWTTQRSYVGIWRAEPTSSGHPHKWHPLFERTDGGDEEEDPQRLAHVALRDAAGDGSMALEVQYTCGSCGGAVSEVMLKAVRAGKPVDLLDRRELFRATIEGVPGELRIREPAADEQEGATVSTYAYDRTRGGFVLEREEQAK